MGWKQKGADYAPTIDWDEQDTFEGVYLGSREVSTSYGTRQIHRFKDMSGEVVEAWGKSRLDRSLDTVDEGTRVLIEYKGMVKIKGGNSVHDFEVSVWEDGEEEPDAKADAKPAAKKPAAKAPAKKPAAKAPAAKKSTAKPKAKPDLDEEPY